MILATFDYFCRNLKRTVSTSIIPRGLRGMDEHLEKRIGHSVLSNVLNAFISQKVLGHNGQQSALITETDQYSKANVSCCWQVRGSYHWVQLTCGSIRQLILVVSKWGDSSMPKGPLSPGTDCSLFCEGRDEFCLKDRQLCGLILGDLEPRNDTFPRYPNLGIYSKFLHQ